jgi:hypothetical protein
MERRLGVDANHTTSGETIGHYNTGEGSKLNSPAALLSNGDYCIKIKDKRVGAERLDSYPSRFVDEALDKADENCIFDLINDRIAFVATREIRPGEQLLGRCGHVYCWWCQHKWPLLLLRATYDKYKHLKLLSAETAQ